MNRKILLLTVVLAVWCTSAYAFQTVYVQSEKVKIFSQPSFVAAKVAEAAKGQQLQVIETQGRWHKVLLEDSITGWVPELVVSTSPPLKKTTVFTGKEEDIGQESRRRASQVTSAAAARGLTDEDRKRLGHRAVADYSSLEAVENITITDSELAGFREALQ